MGSLWGSVWRGRTPLLGTVNLGVPLLWLASGIGHLLLVLLNTLKIDRKYGLLLYAYSVHGALQGGSK